MSLCEAIQHLKEKLSDSSHEWGCEACKQEHEQLLRWLEELRDLKKRDEHVLFALDKTVSATGQHSENDLAFCNGILYAKSLLENREPEFFKDITPEEKTKLVCVFANLFC